MSMSGRSGGFPWAKGLAVGVQIMQRNISVSSLRPVRRSSSVLFPPPLDSLRFFTFRPLAGATWESHGEPGR